MATLRFIVTVLLGCVYSVFAQGRLPDLGEFQVNTTSAGNQTAPRMAADALGNFVVVWESPDSSGSGIAAQRYSAACSPIGAEFPVNSQTANDQIQPTISMAPDGRFVIVWTNSVSGTAIGITGRLYQADGTLVREFSASGSDTGELHYPSVAMDHDGRFIVAWHRGTGSGNERVWAQQFTSAGTPVRAPFQMQPGYAPANELPAVATNSSGDFVITWFADVDEGQAVFMRAYFADGTAKVPLTRVTPVQAGVHGIPAVAMRDDGTFIVVWREASGYDGNGYGVFGQQYSASGVAATAQPFPVNTATGGDQQWASVAVGPNGEFLVVYRSAGFDGSGDAVAAQRFAMDGTSVGEEFSANTYTAGSQQSTSGNGACFIDFQGNLAVVWRSEGQDGSSGGIYADKFYLPNQGPPLSEFRVNTSTAGDQGDPAIAMNTLGQSVIAWTSASGSDPGDIYFQRYDAAGLRVGPETRANVNTNGTQAQPAVGIDESGNSIVVWNSNHVAGEGYNVYVRKFPFDPVAATDGEVLVAGGAGDQTNPSVSVNHSGIFVVGWSDNAGLPSSNYRVYAQRFSSVDGLPADGNRLTAWGAPSGFSGNYGSVAIDPNSRALDITWTAGEGNFSTAGTHLRRFTAADGDSGDLAVNTLTNSSQEGPSALSRRPDGGVFVVFQRDPTNVGSGPFDVYLVPFDAAGQNLGERTVASNSGSEQSPSVVALSNTRALVVWQDQSIDGDDWGIAKAIWDSSTGISGKTRVNSYVSGKQVATFSYARCGTNAVADSAGNYMIVWQSQGQDGSGYGIYASKVVTSASPVVTTSAATDLTASTATLHGWVTPNDVAVDVAFEIAETAAALGTGSATVTAAVPAGLPAGSSAQQVSKMFTGLALGIGGAPKTYYYRARATPQSGGGNFYGATVAFTVQNSAPTAADDTIIILGETTLDPIKQAAPVGTPGQDVDLDPGDPLTIVGNPVGAQQAKSIATTADHLRISYDPADTFPGESGSDSFTYTIQDSHGVQASATVRLYSVRLLAGTYSGLIGADGAGAAAGRLDVTLTRLAQITGSFKWQGQLYTFNQAMLGTDGTFIKAVPKDRTNPAAGTLELSLRLDPLTKILTGTLTDSSTNPATIATVDVTGTATANDLNLEDLPDPGVYTAYIDPGTPTGAAAEFPAEVPSLVLPRGLGFSRVLVAGKSMTKSRPARTVGRMPDDQPFASGAKGLTRALRAASGQAKYSLYIDNLYSRVRDDSNRLRTGGVVSGDLAFSRAGNRMDSSLNWERLPNPSAARFQGGIKGLVATLNAIKYGRPPSGTLPAGIRGDHNPNAKLNLTEGDLVATLTQAAQLTRLGSGGVRSAAFGANAQGFKLSVNANGGSFKGSFVHPVSNELVKFNGVFKDQDGQGVFTGPTTTGRIQILAQ